MEKDTFKTRVVFLVSYNEYVKFWEAIAVFPDIHDVPTRDLKGLDSRFCKCYQHIGQHSDGMESYFKEECRAPRSAAEKKDVAALRRELENCYGYNFDEIKPSDYLSKKMKRRSKAA